jgi:hypothetical protein
VGWAVGCFVGEHDGDGIITPSIVAIKPQSSAPCTWILAKYVSAPSLDAIVSIICSNVPLFTAALNRVCVPLNALIDSWIQASFFPQGICAD